VAELTLAFSDAVELRKTVDEQVSKGRAFVPGESDVAERTECRLVLRAPDGATCSLPGEVVFKSAQGVGVQLAPLDARASAELRAFAERDAPPGSDDGEGSPPSDRPETGEAPPMMHERLRGLSITEQLRIASSGSLPERIALERMYGSSVWEALLKNNRLTIPEVARVARKGTLPRPLVDLIAANAAWLAAPEVQRALLSNPRASGAVTMRVLQALPRVDLARVPQQTAYPMAVRQAAKKMLG
jgi:hypothetical protein